MYRPIHSTKNIRGTLKFLKNCWGPQSPRIEHCSPLSDYVSKRKSALLNNVSHLPQFNKKKTQNKRPIKWHFEKKYKDWEMRWRIGIWVLTSEWISIPILRISECFHRTNLSPLLWCWFYTRIPLNSPLISSNCPNSKVRKDFGELKIIIQ